MTPAVAHTLAVLNAKVRKCVEAAGRRHDDIVADATYELAVAEMEGAHARFMDACLTKGAAT